ncbi:MAG: PPOX class F420-dependent oxidoreductase [Dehalococcoidia bacterium]
MGTPLSPAAQAFLKEKVWAHVATLMKNGTPQVTPVWVDTEDGNILINTAYPRLKARNIERDKRVALSVMGMDDPMRYLSVRGTVKEMRTTTANDDIDRLSLKYTGNPKYQGHRDGETRVTVIIEPTHVVERRL